MRFAQASFRGIHNRQMPPMWVVVGPRRGVFAWHFFNIHFPCVLRPIFRVFVCARCFECLFAPDISPDLRPCVSGGVAPIPTFCPYRARYLLNPVHGGNPGCRSLRSLYPGLIYPCPYRAPRIQNHWITARYMCILYPNQCGLMTLLQFVALCKHAPYWSAI